MAYEDSYVDLAGIRTRYWRAGDSGTAIVLIHGIASSVEDWQDNIGALARDHRVFALDLVGCGLSEKPADHDYSLESLARFVLEFMTVLKIETAHLIGFSLGGHLALKCVQIAPQRGLSLVLADPAGMGRETIINFRLATIRGLGEVLTRPSRWGMNMLLRTAFHDPSKVTSQMVEDRLHLAKLPGAQAAFLKMLRGFVGFGGFEPKRVADLESWLPSVTRPVLVIWGEQDRFVPARHAQFLASRLPNCRIKLYQNCGHLPHVELSEKFNADVARFLAEVDSRPAPVRTSRGDLA